MREEGCDSGADDWPPGEYVDEEQQALTRRFIEEARTFAERRERAAADPFLEEDE